MATEDKSQLPPFSPEDEKEAQKELDRLHKGLREYEKGAINVNRKPTGFEDKTLWDKLNLFGTLAIPVILALATIGFGFWQVHLADLQHNSDQMIAQQQHEADKQSALDQQQSAILQTYIDNIQDLLLNHNLLKSKSGDNVATLARARTLTALQGLDPKRRGVLIQFLYQAKLISKSNVIVDLNGADLSNADLSEANLGGANLNGVNLDDANLYNVNLSEAILSGANLDNANLHYANLFKATLTFFTVITTDQTNTITTYLLYADLRNANLSGANLEGAELGGADLIEASLDVTKLSGAKLDGAKYNTKAVQGKDAQGKLEFDDQGKPFMIKPTSWPQGFDPRIAMAFCVDC